MNDLEKRAYYALNQAFCRLRYFSRRPLNEKGREHLFLVSDAAHNIPDALAGNQYLRENLERYVLELEALLEEPYEVASARFIDHGGTLRRESLFAKLTLGGIAAFILLGCLAGLVAAFTEVSGLWNTAYILLGFSLLLGIFYRVAVELQKRGLW